MFVELRTFFSIKERYGIALVMFVSTCWVHDAALYSSASR